MFLYQCKKRFYTLIAICTMGSFFPLASMEESRDKSDEVQAPSPLVGFVSGVLAGTADVTVAQPFEYAKNRIQCDPSIKLTGKRLVSTLWANRHAWYTGATTKYATMIGTTAFQVMMRDRLQTIFPGTDLTDSALRSTIPGALAASFITPLDLIFQQVQYPSYNEPKRKVRDTAQHIFNTTGARGLMRGLSAKAGREGVFSFGFLYLQQRLNAALLPYIPNDIARNIIAGFAAGSPIAVLSQPFDTLAAEMQRDYRRQKAKTSWQMARLLYREGGIKRFYTGGASRYFSIVISLCVMSPIVDYCRNRQSST